MLLKSKQIAFLGLLVAIAVILVILAGIIESSTLFLLSAASFAIGIAIRETNLRMGAAFFVATSVLSFLLAPNKLYCITFIALGIYLLGSEVAFEIIARSTTLRKRTQILWIFKWLIFNSMYIPSVIFLPTLVFQVNSSIEKQVQIPVLTGLALVFGQVFLVVYDYAYHYFQKNIWKQQWLR